MPEWLDFESIRPAYDADADILYLTFGSPRSGTTVDQPGGAWLRVDSVTGEIFGVEIQDFESAFLQRHPQAAPDWSAIRDTKLETLATGPRVALVKSILKQAALTGDHAPTRT